MRWLISGVLMFLLVGCGGSSDPGTSADAPRTSAAAPTPTPTPTLDPAELRTAVTAYSSVFLTGEAPIAHSMLSQRCQKVIPLKRFAPVVQKALETYGRPLRFLTYSATITGETARVTYTYRRAELNQTEEPWVYENGEWRDDDC